MDGMELKSGGERWGEVGVRGGRDQPPPAESERLTPGPAAWAQDLRKDTGKERFVGAVIGRTGAGPALSRWTYMD